MSTLTKEWLLKTIAELEEERDAVPGIVNEDAAKALAAMKLALASLEAKAMTQVLSSRAGNDTSTIDKALPEGTMLYTAPPALVSVPDELTREEYKRRFMEEDNFDDTFRGGWSACRAAMLQGADGKPELTVWYGAMPETNGKTNWTAMLHRKGHHPWEGITIDRSEYPGRVRYEADRMRHLIGELADEPDILAYDSDAHSGYVEPVTTAYKLPAEAVYGYFAFNDHHGEEFFKKREDAIAFCKEAIEEYRQENAEEGCDPDEVRRTCWGIIMQEGTDFEVDNEGHIDYALTPELAGDSPVIPDGWVACSERMPDIGTEIFYFCQDDGLRDCGIVSSSNFSGKGDAELYVHAEGYDLRFGVDISHWIPLPASPQQK